MTRNPKISIWHEKKLPGFWLISGDWVELLTTKLCGFPKQLPLQTFKKRRVKLLLPLSYLRRTKRVIAVVIATAQLHSTNTELRFCAGSNPARGMSEIRDGENLWQWPRLEIVLNAFRRSTIPQKQFIIIIIIIIITIIIPSPKYNSAQTEFECSEQFFKKFFFFFLILLIIRSLTYIGRMNVLSTFNLGIISNWLQICTKRTKRETTACFISYHMFMILFINKLSIQNS